MQDAVVLLERASRLIRGEVMGFAEDGAALVSSSDRDSPVVACDVLQVSEPQPVRLHAGDVVLYVTPTVEGERGVVFGRLGKQTAREDAGVVPPHVVIEARANLTLKCGSGSITIREDGKILIKGKDLVSHATRLNRIKGGAVQIN